MANTTTINIDKTIKGEFDELFEELYGAKPSISSFTEKQMSARIEEMKLEKAAREAANAKKAKK